MRRAESSRAADAVIPRRSQSVWLAAILLVAVLLRVGIALYLGDVVDAPPLLTDQRSYHALGERLLQGTGIALRRPGTPLRRLIRPRRTGRFSIHYS